MRHQKEGRKFGRTSGPRKGLFRSILRSLFLHGKIVTTLTKAKECAPKADKIITLAKRAERKIGEMQQKVKASVKGEITSELQAEIAKRAQSIQNAYYRRVFAKLPDKALIQKIFADIIPLYANRQGGYTSVLHLNRPRVGDNTPQAVLKLVEFPETGEKGKTTEEKKAEKEKLKKEKVESKRKRKERKEKRKQKEVHKKEQEKEKKKQEES